MHVAASEFYYNRDKRNDFNFKAKGLFKTIFLGITGGLGQRLKYIRMLSSREHWHFLVLIGLGTELVGFFNNIAIENIASFKLLLFNNLMLEDRYFQAFVAYVGCNLLLAIALAALCTYIAFAAIGSSILGAKAYLNGVDAHSILVPSPYLYR
ncbi:hypothetical protein L1049_019963 [Liquidambar formosana]|uniref:Uncharacterized protein n=1 Tax=Liquidambar formosana TaxID=63359 RepID=A0AAP0SCE8_LIQFO